MLASTRSSLARSGASPALRVASRRVCLPRARARFQSIQTAAAPSSGSAASYVAAGVAGGAVVLVGGYSVYHFSGAKQTVQSAQSAHAYLQETKDKVSASVASTLQKSDPGAALAYLRRVAHTYAALLPGAGGAVDAAFDRLDAVAAQHGDAANEIAQGAYAEIQKIVQDAQAKGGKTSGAAAALDWETAGRVAEVLRRRLDELYELGKKAGGDALDEVLAAHPELREKLGGGYEALKSAAEAKGPEAAQLLEDTRKQIQEIFAKGFSVDAANHARQLIQEKTTELQSVLDPAAREAWDAALSQAQPYLAKLPAVRDLLAGPQAGALAAAFSGAGGGAQELVERIKAAAQASGKEQEQRARELKDYLTEKAKAAAQQTAPDWAGVLDYVRALPGGAQLLERAPSAGALLELSKARGDEAKSLAQETWDAVLGVLEEKGQEARELAKRAEGDVKKEAGKGQGKEEKQGGKGKDGEKKQK